MDEEMQGLIDSLEERLCEGGSDGRDAYIMIYGSLVTEDFTDEFITRWDKKALDMLPAKDRRIALVIRGAEVARILRTEDEEE